MSLINLPGKNQNLGGICLENIEIWGNLPGRIDILLPGSTLSRYQIRLTPLVHLTFLMYEGKEVGRNGGKEKEGRRERQIYLQKHRAYRV